MSRALALTSQSWRATTWNRQAAESGGVGWQHEKQAVGRAVGRVAGQQHMHPPGTPLLCVSLLCLQVVRLAAMAGKAAIVWQEAFDQGVPLPSITRVQVWKWWREGKQQARPGSVSGSGSSDGTSSDGGISMRDAAAVGGSVAASRRALLEPLSLGDARCDTGFSCEDLAAGDDDAWKAELQARAACDCGGLETGF